VKILDRVGEEDEVKVTNLKSVDEIHSLDSLDKVEEIIPIDDDLAEKMRAQIEGNSALDINSLVSKTGSSSDSLSTKVQRLYNLFGINDIDDIIKVIPIRSMKKIGSSNGLNLNYENGYESEYETNSRLSNTGVYEESLSNYRNPNSRLETYDRNNQGRVYATDPARLYLDHRTDAKNPRIIETGGQQQRGVDSYIETGGQQQRGVDSYNTRENYKEYQAPIKTSYNSYEERRGNQQDLDELNREISLINDDINNRMGDLMERRNELGREHEFINALDQMVQREREKIQAILQVKQDHQNKAVSIKESISNLRSILERSNAEKIRYLDQLQSMAGQEKKRDLDRLNHIQTFQVPELIESRNLNRERQVVKGQPLVKVKNLTKINKILPLSNTQGELLKQWQSERN